jgi:serine/threonine protein phosphatase PrpC
VRRALDQGAQPEFERRLLFGPDGYPPLSALVHVEVAAKSRRGPARRVNTDHYLALKLGRSQETVLTSVGDHDAAQRFDEQAFAMVIADGMGESGEIASGLAINALLQLAVRFGRWQVRVDDLAAPDIIARLSRFYRQIDGALSHVNQSGVGAPLHTTLTAAVSGGRDLFFAHVGHSRAYLLRAGELIQLTRDHTHAILREQAHVRLVDLTDVATDLQHVLTDALGAGAVDPQIDVERLTLVDRDLVLLCTNGLTDAIGDEVIADILGASRPVDDLCEALVACAAAQEAEDDVTVLLSRYHVPA